MKGEINCMTIQFKKLFFTYYLIIILIALNDIYLTFSRYNFKNVYETYTVKGLSFLNYVIFGFAAIAFILSFVLIILIYKNKMPKINLIVPFAYIFY